jgi:hypothetical protein
LGSGLIGLSTFAGWESWLFFGAFTALGSLAVVAGFAALSMRVVVDDRGITKGFWVGTVEFQVSWDALESWSVLPNRRLTAQQLADVSSKMPFRAMPRDLSVLLDGEDSMTFHVALFKVRDKSGPVAVYDSEACRPSFRAFIEDVRSHAKEKEVLTGIG